MPIWNVSEQFLGTSRQVDGYQITVCRAGTPLRRQHCATSVFSVVVRWTRATVSVFILNFKRRRNNLVALHFKYDQARRRFVEWAQNEIAVVPDFNKRILFSDEVHFWLNGYVNKQNCRIWSEANPQVYVETPLHPEKLTVW
ncbi:hypothetical protein TNCV_183551 [Trichonephila clavipes]|nr:hypothetical protein TNCV_183551 [Trichonephila clavipes]